MTIAPQDGLTIAKRSYLKMKKDPVRYAKHLKRCRLAQGRYLAKIRADPERHKVYMKKWRKLDAKYRRARGLPIRETKPPSPNTRDDAKAIMAAVEKIASEKTGEGGKK